MPWRGSLEPVDDNAEAMLPGSQSVTGLARGHPHAGMQIETVPPGVARRPRGHTRFAIGGNIPRCRCDVPSLVGAGSGPHRLPVACPS
jgi:hypothetical protein